MRNNKDAELQTFGLGASLRLSCGHEASY